MGGIGFTFSFSRLLKGAVAEAGEIILGPIKAVGRMTRSIRSSRARLHQNANPKEFLKT